MWWIPKNRNGQVKRNPGLVETSEFNLEMFSWRSGTTSERCSTGSEEYLKKDQDLGMIVVTWRAIDETLVGERVMREKEAL